VIALIGADWFRGGRHFDLSAYESGPIFGGAPEWAGRGDADLRGPAVTARPATGLARSGERPAPRAR
jgi:hypothetical protein